MSEQELKLKLDDVFFTQDSSAAIKLIQALKAKGSLSDFENFVYQANFLDRDDPVKAWTTLEKKQDELIRKLKGA